MGSESKQNNNGNDTLQYESLRIKRTKTKTGSAKKFISSRKIGCLKLRPIMCLMLGFLSGEATSMITFIFNRHPLTLILTGLITWTMISILACWLDKRYCQSNNPNLDNAFNKAEISKTISQIKSLSFSAMAKTDQPQKIFENISASPSKDSDTQKNEQSQQDSEKTARDLNRIGYNGWQGMTTL